MENQIEPPAVEFGEDQLVFTYLPKDVVVGDREVSIDYGHFDGNNKDLMLCELPHPKG